MKPNLMAMINKRAELVEVASNACLTTRLPQAAPLLVVDAFASLSCPIEPEGLERITIDAVVPGATSRKAGNICLSWRRVIDVLPDITIAIASTSGPPWLLFLVCLYVWNRVLAGAEVAFSQEEAAVLYALWLRRDQYDGVPIEEGLSTANEMLVQHDASALSARRYGQILTKLSNAQCVTIDNGVITLVETVSVEYT